MGADILQIRADSKSKVVVCSSYKLMLTVEQIEKMFRHSCRCHNKNTAIKMCDVSYFKIKVDS